MSCIMHAIESDGKKTRKNALPLKKWVETYMAVIPRLCTANRSFLLFCFILLAHEWLELLGEKGSE